MHAWAVEHALGGERGARVCRFVRAVRAAEDERLAVSALLQLEGFAEVKGDRFVADRAVVVSRRSRLGGMRVRVGLQLCEVEYGVVFDVDAVEAGGGSCACEHEERECAEISFHILI